MHTQERGKKKGKKNQRGPFFFPPEAAKTAQQRAIPFESGPPAAGPACLAVSEMPKTGVLRNAVQA